ncbi:hypothetical protein HK405_013610, partial [Cladochytrium tenue]
MAAAAVLNAQVHINNIGSPKTLDDLLIANDAPSDVPFGYVLQHKHFELNEGEVLLYDFVSDSKIVCEVGKMPDGWYPVMYYTDANGSYIPIAYARDKCHAVAPPSRYLGPFGICSESFATPVPLTEVTDVDSRRQAFVKGAGFDHQSDVNTITFLGGGPLRH